MVRIVRIRQDVRRCGSAAAMLAVAILGLGFGGELLATPAMAAPPTWTARFNQGSRDGFAKPAHRESHGAASAAFPFLGSHAVATDAAGNVYVAGSVTLDTLDHQDFLVEKYDAAGNLVWYRTTDGGSHLEDTAFCLAVSANAVFVTGETCTTSNCDPDFLTVKYDSATGGQLWAKRADGPGHDWDTGPCIAVDALGDPVVAGTTANPPLGPGNTSNISDFLTIKYNGTTGSEIWRQTKSTGTTFSAEKVGALAVGVDGHVVVAGWGDGATSMLVVKYNGVSGAEVWTVNDTSLADSEVQAIALDSASNPIVVGQADGSGDSKFLTVKYSAITGAQAWIKKVNNAAGAPESAHDVAVDGLGNAYVTGRLRLFNAYTFFTAKYRASDGAEQWSHNFGTGVLNDDYVPTAIAYSAATDRVTVTGYRGAASDHDFFTESIPAASGNGALEILHTAPRDDYAVALAVDPSGNAILAGLSDFPGSQHLLVLKYDTSLVELWSHLEPAIESHDVVGGLYPPELGRKKIAVDSLGNTVVVGSTASSASSSGDNDFLIQKYGPGGDRLWSRTVDGGFGDDFATAVALDSAGNIFVTGWSTGNGTGYDILTMRLDPANGNTVWAKRFDGAAHSNDVSYSLALGKLAGLGGDGAFVSGASFDGARYNVTVLGYPVADGNSPWVSTINFGGDSFAYAVAAGCQTKILGVCEPGVYITGLSRDSLLPGSTDDFMTALLYGSTGVPVWSAVLLPTGTEVGYAIAAVGSPSTVAVTGTQDGDWLTAVFQGASPTPLWTIRRDFDGRDDQAHDVAFDLAGNVFVTGSAIKTPARNKQVTTVKYAGSNGAELAVSRLGPIDEDQTGYGVATDFAGNVYVAGSRFVLSSQKNDFLFLRYTNDLGLLDFDFLDSAGSDDQGTALAVERNSGDAVVAGTTFGTSAAGDFLIAKYRAPEQGYFFTTAPCRLYDSRNDVRGPISGGQTRVLSALGFVGSCPLLTPAVKSLAINVTVVSGTAGGYLQLYAGNISAPNTTVLNFAAGQTRANNAVLNLATNAAGTFVIRSGLPPGQTVHVIVDVAGYFD